MDENLYEVETAVVRVRELNSLWIEVVVAFVKTDFKQEVSFDAAATWLYCPDHL